MALHYNIEKVAQSTKDSDSEWPWLEALCYNMITTGMQKLEDEDDARKFFARYATSSAAYGHDPLLVMLDHAKAWIGLTTNVLQETDFAFAKRMRLVEKRVRAEAAANAAAEAKAEAEAAKETYV